MPTGDAMGIRQSGQGRSVPGPPTPRRSGRRIVGSPHPPVDDAVRIQPGSLLVSPTTLPDGGVIVCLDTTVENHGPAPVTRRLDARLLASDDVELSAESSPVTVLSGEGSIVHQRMSLPAPAASARADLRPAHADLRVRLSLRDGERVVDECTADLDLSALDVTALGGITALADSVADPWGGRAASA